MIRIHFRNEQGYRLIHPVILGIGDDRNPSLSKIAFDFGGYGGVQSRKDKVDTLEPGGVAFLYFHFSLLAREFNGFNPMSGFIIPVSGRAL